jgi:3'-phosphoadenosine 5'-phosphosulfate sulfotransferase
LLQIAVERYVERLEQRNDGAENALARLRTNPHGEGIWLGQFVDAIFQDFLLNTPDGAAFVLRALSGRKIQAPVSGTVESILYTMSISAFGDLLRQKTDEELERRIGYQAVSPASVG